MVLGRVFRLHLLFAAAALLAVPASIVACTPSAGATSKLGSQVTLYEATGAEPWFNYEIAKFEAKYHVHVNIVDTGSGVLLSRALLEKAHPEADVLVALPPFIEVAAEKGLLAPTHLAVEKTALPTTGKGYWYSLINNYENFIYNPKIVKPAPKTWKALLSSSFAGKISYSNPSEAGDGFAVLWVLQHEFGVKGAFNYLKKLQANVEANPPGTGSQDALVSKGEVWVANGDVQMDLSDAAHGDDIKVWFPKDTKGQASTFSDPYAAGLVKNAPNAAAGRALLQFLFSKTAQSKIPSLCYGLPGRTSIHPKSPVYDTWQKLLKGVKIFSVTWKDVVKEEPTLLKGWETKVQGS
jgi:2-aminoethylphosphonate transport system substrate-binding protein